MTLAVFLQSQTFVFDRLEQSLLLDGAIGRLAMACLLGGIVGLEREIKRKAAGVRTNMRICMGSAFFTLLSAVLVGPGVMDKSRIASNIVQGIGFIGAGLIIRNESRVSGLTSAAGVYVVASIGMACGAGLYGVAATVVVMLIAALEVVGFLEQKANLKIYPRIYEARGHDHVQIMVSILDAMDKTGERLTSTQRDTIGDLERVSFQLTANKKQHGRVQEKLRSEPAIDALLTFRDPEED